MKGAGGRLQFFLRILLLGLESRIFEFGFFSGFNQEKSLLLASVVVAPQLIAMPTQSLCGSVVKLLSHKFLWLRGSVGSGWRFVCCWSCCGFCPLNILIKSLLLKSCEGYHRP
ncbi:hypothetical protein BHE74_00059271 [Ensete ventricosum]|nr:hypothetical protein BHE74_00059271 [Ensete ventricosum]